MRRLTIFLAVSGAPLAGADVQLVRTDGGDARVLSATADASGRYHIDSVAAGHYLAAFFHPMLDSLGVTLRQSQVNVAAGETVKLALTVPSATTLQRALCDARAVTPTTALLLGWVRDASTERPHGAAAVHVSWSDVVLKQGGPSTEAHEVTVPTRDDGWFAACGVPGETELRLRGVAGADSSGEVVVQAVGGAVVRRDLVIGAGRARLAGVVRTASGRPLVGARVWVVGAPDTVATGDGGTFALAAVSVGSHVLEARAVGYVPATTAVNVHPDVPNDSRRDAVIEMTSLSAYLDTVKTVRDRVYATDPGGFEARRRASGTGFFVDRARIARLGTLRTLNVLALQPGLQTRGGGENERLLMRSDIGLCVPAVFVDRVLYGNLTPTVLDGIAPADRIAGIEIYNEAFTAPSEFQRGLCGSVVIWTVNAPDYNKKPSKSR